MKKIFTTALLSLPVLAMAGVMNVNASGINSDDISKNPAQGKNNSALPCAAYPAPTASAVTICAGEVAVLTATGTGAAELIWYTSATGGTAVDNNATITIEDLTATTSYWVEENELTGCPENARTEVIVTVNELPEVTATASATFICGGNEVTLTGGGITDGTYSWNNMVVDGEAFEPAESARFLVTGEDENGCQDTVSVFVSVYNMIGDAGDDFTVCPGVSFQLFPVPGYNGAPAYTGGLNEESFDPGFPQTITEETTYTLTVTAGACVTTDEITVSVHDVVPTVSAGVDQTVCAGIEVTLQATAEDAEDIEWDNDVVDNEAFTPTETATYIVLATALNGCEDTDTVTVTVNFMPSADANEDTTVCAGMTFTLPAATYDASPAYSDGVNAPFNPGVPQNITTETTYTLTVTAGTCVATDEITVFVNPTPVATATLTGVATLNAATAPGQTYQWINCATDAPIAGATAATYEATANGSYKVEVSNGNCEATSACVNVTTLGVAENTADLGITLYPNPTTGKVFVSTSNNETVAVTVYNAQGAVVAAFGKVQNGEVIELTNVEAGIYVIRVATAQGTAVSRIVKN